MISGPLSLRLVGELLGKTEDAVRMLIKDERLPVCRINTDRRPMERVYFAPLLAWMNERSVNMKWTEAMLDAELERCAKRLAHMDAERKKRKQGRQREAEPQAA